MNLNQLICIVGLFVATAVPAKAEAGLVSWLSGCGWNGQYCGACYNCYGSSYLYSGYAPFYSSYGTYGTYYTPSYSYASYYTPSYSYASYYTPSYSYYTPSYSYYSPSYYGSGCNSCGFGQCSYGCSSYGCGASSCGLGGCGSYGCGSYCPSNCNSCGVNYGSYCPSNCNSCGNNCVTNYASNCGNNCSTNCGVNCVSNYSSNNANNNSNCNNPMPQATEKNTNGGTPTQANKTQEQKTPDDGFGPRQNEPEFNPPQTVPQKKEGETRNLKENFVKLERRITWQTRPQRTRLNIQARFSAPLLARKDQNEKLVHWTAPTQTVSVTDK